MRSSYKSWFIGTLKKDDRFYHVENDDTHKQGYILGYSPHDYGCLKGIGWVSLKRLERLDQERPRDLNDSDRRKLRVPEALDSECKGLRSHCFIDKYAHSRHKPTAKSQDAQWPVTIKKGASVPLYVNQRGGRPVAKQFHHKQPHLTSEDDGNKLKVRYVVKENPDLMVVNFTSPKHGNKGYWGFILKEGDNFTVDFK